MPYNPNIPQPNDQLSVSQGDILANFQALAPVGAGYLLLELLGADPATGATQEAIYSRTGAISTEQELFLKRNAGSGYPASAQNFTFTEATMAQTGWTRLPSGILLKWGLSGAIPIGGAGVNLNGNGPDFAQVFTAVATGTIGGPLNPVYVVAVAPGTLSLNANPLGNGGAFYLVIGV